MQKNICLIILISLSLTSFSQNLKRKGSLGIGLYSNTPDSVKERLNYTKGCVVHTIYPNTTAAAIGLQVDDIIITENNVSIVKPTDIFAVAKTLRATEDISLLVIRNGKPVSLKGKVVAKPMETSTTANVVYGEFKYKNGYVRTIYKTLKDKKPKGTIYFVQGLPCYSMDNFQALDKTKQALDAMVDRGYAVYRMEKADMGDNIGQNPCEGMAFNEEYEMYVAGYKNLLTLKEVDATKVVIFGHSLGGIVAPLLSEQFQPKAVVVYGTGFKPWMEYLMDAYIIQTGYYGDDPIKMKDTLESIKPYILDYFSGKKTLEETVADPKGLFAMEAIMSYNPQTKLAASGRSPQFMKEVNEQNLKQAWAKTSSYVLAIYGEADIAANNADDHIALIKHVNANHPNKGTFWLAPKTTHMFEEIGTMQDYINWQKDVPAYLKYAATKFNAKVFDYACKWMDEVINK